MKVLAVVALAKGADIAEVRRRLKDELRGAWGLFSANIMREAYTTDDPERIVFVLEAVSLAAAQAHLSALPLVADGSFTLQLSELRPFVNWERLFAEGA